MSSFFLPSHALPGHRGVSRTLLVRRQPLACAVQAALVGMLLLSAMPQQASAQTAEAASAAQAVDIAAGPLADVLSRFAAQAGVALSFDPTQVAGVQSQGVRGTVTPRQGFEQILDGTGFDLVQRGDGYGLRRLPQAPGVETLSTISVTAADQSLDLLPLPYAGGQVAQGVRLGVLGNTSNMKAPFSTTSYTAEAIGNLQANTIAEAVNRDPSVRYTVLPGGNVDNLYIRGFPIWEGNSGEIAFDGIYGVAPNYRVRTEYVERIEVVKGPGALLFGMSPNGSVGGVINIAPKRALEDSASLTTTYTSDSQFKGHLDVGRRFGEDEEFGIRLNGSYYGGDTTMKHQSVEGNVGALALDYAGTRFRATLDLLSQNERIDATGRPIMLAGNFDMPDAPDGKINVTQPWEWSRNRERAALLRTEFDVTDSLSVFANVGTSGAKVSRVYDSAPRLISASGDTLITPTYAIFEVDRRTFDGGLRARFETGSVKHSVTLQASAYREVFDRALNPGTAVQSNIYDPVYYPEQNIARPSEVPRIHDNRNTSLALVDTMTLFDDTLQLSLGVRRQKIKSTNYNVLSGGGSSVYDESVTTPAVGIVVNPSRNWSLYANYIEGLSKGEIAPPAASNYGEVMAPYKSKQYEIGTKYDFGDMFASLSLFQIEKPSGGLNQGVFSVNGEQRNRGLELYGYGEVRPGLRVLGGVTLLQSKMTSSGNPALVGNRPIGVPRLMANLGVEWDVPVVPRLTLTGDLVHTGRQYVNQTNSAEIPAWTRFDLGARYVARIAGHTTTFRATVQNVADRAYWAGVTSWGAASPATPRTFVLSATVDF